MSRGKPCHVEIVITDQSQVERMIKKFTRKCKKQGLFDELKERRYFKKKSLKMKEKRENKKMSFENHDKPNFWTPHGNKDP